MIHPRANKRNMGTTLLMEVFLTRQNAGGGGLEASRLFSYALAKDIYSLTTTHRIVRRSCFIFTIALQIPSPVLLDTTCYYLTCYLLRVHPHYDYDCFYDD